MAEFRRNNNRDSGSRSRGGFGGGRSGGDRGGFGGGRRSGGFGDREGRGDARRGGFSMGRSFERRPLQMTDAICDKCKKPCQVPFKPSGGKPVYCRDCFNQNDSSSFSPRSNASPSTGISVEQFNQINAKLDKILKILEMVEIEESAEEDLEEESKEDSEEDPSDEE